jgi:hypothetical protein
METPLPPDFKEFLALLNSEKIDYLLVGGYAVSYHGYPRPTGDLDVWVDSQPDSAARLISVLSKFGFAGPGVTPELFLTPGRVVRMGVPPVRIEIINKVSGLDFSASYPHRVEAVLDGVPVRIIAREDLIVNKTAAGRDKDLNDLKHLEGRGPG